MNIARKIFAFAMVVMAVTVMSGFGSLKVQAANNGDLVKLSTNSAVYYINGTDRYAFPNQDTYMSWYSDFSMVKVISQAEMSTHPLVGNVTVRPSTKLFKITSDPRTYAVGMDRTIYHISSESEAINMYGPNWASMVFDMQDGFFSNYTMGGQKPSGQYTAGQLVKAAGSPKVYYYNGSQYREITTEASFYDNRFNFNYVVTAPSGFSMSPLGSPITGMEADLVNTAQATPGTTQPGFNPSGGTQGVIEEIQLGSRNKTEALEGQSNVEIYATDVELSNDGPLMLQSADVWFAANDHGEGDDWSLRPWNYFSNVSLMLDGTVLTTTNAGASSNWSSVATGNISGDTTAEYRMRFTGLSGVLASDDTSKLSVAVSMHNNIDSKDEEAVWNIELGNVRTLDESGLTMERSAPDLAVSDSALEEQFTVGGVKKASLEVRTANPKMEASLIQVSETADTNGVSVYNFTMKEKNGVGMTIQDLQVNFTTTGTTTENTVIRRAYLYEGAAQKSVKTVPNGGATLFNNVNIALAANQTKTFTVMVDLFDNNEGNRYVEGTTLTAAVVATNLRGTDVNGHEEDEWITSFSATSETHELRSLGIAVTLDGAPTATVTTVDEGADVVLFTWKVKVNAFGDEDILINRTPARIVSTDSGTAVNIVYSIEAGDALQNPGGTISTSSSGVTEVTHNGINYFQIPSNSTENMFTITVNATNAVGGDPVAPITQQVRGLLENIEWTFGTPANTADGTNYTFNLGNKAATPYVVIN